MRYAHVRGAMEPDDRANADPTELLTINNRSAAVRSYRDSINRSHRPIDGTSEVELYCKIRRYAGVGRWGMVQVKWGV